MSNKKMAWLAAVALFFMLIITGRLTARGSNSSNHPQETGTPSNLQKVGNGQEMKTIGIVVKRNADSFIMKEQSGVLRAVALTPQTTVKTHRKGAFRGGKEYGVSYILRGLRLEVIGRGNEQGQLVAEKIRFDEDDLRTAQALEVRVDPVEEQAEANKRQIEENRIAAEKLAAENKAAAEKAQLAADEAAKSAAIANDRINGLDDYDPVRTITVLFASGKRTLGPKGRAEIDSAAAWVKTQNRNGWVVAVIGFADTQGNSPYNRSLSESRAKAVINYLVTKHNLPLQRLVQPFGYGDSNPVAENTTEEGRAKNRRVEIRLLANKGIANIP